jgi:hypothetical protein
MKSIIVDSQLLLLLVVGVAARSDISETKRLSNAYTEYDFDRLAKFIVQFDKVITLPNILSEVSNFIGDSDLPRTKRARETLKAIMSEALEIYQPSLEVVNQPEFDWLGITDVAQLLLLADGHSLITNDGRLYAAALNRGLNAVTLAEIPA